MPKNENETQLMYRNRWMAKIEKEMLEMKDMMGKMYDCIMGNTKFGQTGLYPRFEEVENWYKELKDEPVLEAAQEYSHRIWMSRFVGVSSIVSMVGFIVLLGHTIGLF